jgi:hypothetical protein
MSLSQGLVSLCKGEVKIQGFSKPMLLVKYSGIVIPLVGLIFKTWQQGRATQRICLPEHGPIVIDQNYKC